MTHVSIRLALYIFIGVAITIGVAVPSTAKAADFPFDSQSIYLEVDAPDSESNSSAVEEVRPETPLAAAPRNFFVPSRSTGTRTEPELPPYARNLEDVELFKESGTDWIDLGVDYRMRYEYRDDDLRRPVAIVDEPFLLRTRVYAGIHDRFDPFRGYFEFEDARRYNGHFAEDNRDVNETEFIQAVGELYFADALGVDRPLRLQAGRFAFEYVDRRLIGRNAWRNTTNNFQGFRAIFGQEENDWQVDVLAWQPMERLLTRPDRVDEERWFYGAIANWRRWSDVVTIQPYYLVLDQNGKGANPNRNIHTAGLRAYGTIPETNYDFDVQEIFQFGRHAGGSHLAFAATAELGYTFEHAARPRISAFAGYASGDRNPNDNRNERFERLFGFARPWSANDYITFENVIAPKTRLEMQLPGNVKFDAGYGVFWLASDSDAWPNAQLQDPTGQSGRFLGHEFDVRLRFAVGSRTDVTLGYAHFIPGEFPRNLGKPNDSDFFYVEVAPRLFK